MNRDRAAAHAAFLTIRWTVRDDGSYSADSGQLLAALEHSYRIGYKHARADAAQAVGELLADHELVLAEEDTK
jgi:hypothetical protein